VAARGYGLALAGQLSILFLIARAIRAEKINDSTFTLISVISGLVVCAHYTFAPVVASTLALFFWWIRPSSQWLSTDSVKQASLLLFPGALVVAVICGVPIARMSRDALYPGTTSLTHFIKSIVDFVFLEPYPTIVPSVLQPVFGQILGVAPALLAVLLLAS